MGQFGHLDSFVAVLPSQQRLQRTNRKTLDCRYLQTTQVSTPNFHRVFLSQRTHTFVHRSLTRVTPVYRIQLGQRLDVESSVAKCYILTQQSLSTYTKTYFDCRTEQEQLQGEGK